MFLSVQQKKKNKYYFFLTTTTICQIVFFLLSCHSILKQNFMYQDYPHFFTATILEWKKRIAYKNLSHLRSQSAIDLFAAVGGLRHTYSGFGEHLQGLQKSLYLSRLTPHYYDKIYLLSPSPNSYLATNCTKPW